MPEHLRGGACVDGGGHDEQAQIRPQGALRIQRQREPEIRLETPLVEFIEQDGAHAAELRIIEEAPREEALREHEDAGLRAEAAFEAQLVADGLSRRFAEEFRHTPGGGAGRHAARFEQQNPAVKRLEQRGRHERGFPGARSGRQHRAGVFPQSIGEFRQNGTHRQIDVTLLFHVPINIADAAAISNPSEQNPAQGKSTPSACIPPDRVVL